MIPRPNAVRHLVALVALTACAGRAAREEPTRFERPVGAVTVDGFAVQVTVVASSRQLGVIRGGSHEAVVRTAPTGNLNDRVLSMRPAWCTAADAAP